VIKKIVTPIARKNNSPLASYFLSIISLLANLKKNNPTDFRSIGLKKD